MRHGASIGTGIGMVVVLASLSSPQDPSELQHALDETVRALAVLSGLEQGTKNTVELARSASEQALGDERQRDERLQTLRKDVGRLQMAHDELVHAAGTPRDDVADLAGGDTTAAASLAFPIAITTGLDDRQRAQLSGEPHVAFVLPSLSSGGSSSTSTATARDDGGDALRQGQALFRGAKYTQALIVLRRIESDVRAKYWIARTLEKLARVEEAIELYRAVEGDADAGYLAPRAKNDREFLEWKRDFAAKLERSRAKAESSSKDAPKDAPKQPAKPAETPKQGPAKSSTGTRLERDA